MELFMAGRGEEQATHPCVQLNLPADLTKPCPQASPTAAELFPMKVQQPHPDTPGAPPALSRNHLHHVLLLADVVHLGNRAHLLAFNHLHRVLLLADVADTFISEALVVCQAS